METATATQVNHDERTQPLCASLVVGGTQYSRNVDFKGHICNQLLGRKAMRLRLVQRWTADPLVPAPAP